MERASIQRLREEIKQNKAFIDHSHAAALALARTADELRRSFGAVIEPHGISLEQYNVLRILRGAGPEGLPTLEIAARLLERNPGITRLLDKLEAKKLVIRERCKEDRRQVLCYLTAEGSELVSKLDSSVTAANRSVFSGLSPGQLDEFIDLLDRIRYRDIE